MAEIFKFFNSAPGDERWYYASDFAEYFGDVLSSGLLYEEGGTNLQVRVVQGTLKTIVEPGKALIKGYRYWNTTPLELTHNIPEIDADRIDRIVLRMDIRNNARSIKAFVKEGMSAVEPVPPELQRDNYVYELSLAQVRVTKNTASLVPENLVDERMYEELCGTVSSIISVPTTVFQQQWDIWFDSKKVTLDDDMKDWMEGQQQAFTDWLATIQGLLDGDVAANLANYIANVDSRLTSHLAQIELIPTKATTIAKVVDYSTLDTTTEQLVVCQFPDGKWWYVETKWSVAIDSGQKMQQATQYISGSDFMVRFCFDNVWGPWSPSLQEVFQSVSNGKQLVANAITQKGIWTAPDAEFATMATNIMNISTGKKWASGTVNPSSDVYNSWYIQVNNLGFKPRVFLAVPEVSIQNDMYNRVGHLLTAYSLYIDRSVLGTPMDVRYYYSSSGVTVFPDGEVRFLISDNVAKMPINVMYSHQTVKWMAFE